MGRQDLFRNLPSEITTNILSRLPFRSISISKCVCKAWLDLIESDYFDFVKSKIKTPFTMVRKELHKNSIPKFTIWEFEDEDEADALHFHPSTDIRIPYFEWWQNWVQQTNGLLLIYSESECDHNYICNPLTREYIDLGRPDVSPMGDGLYFGFGVSKIGQYKVVCVNPGAEYHHVYTLGTGTWRRIEAGATSGCRFDDNYREDHYTVCNGNPHWTVYNIDKADKTLRICAFDVETESFNVFSAPDAHGHAGDEAPWYVRLSVLGGCLCLSYALGESEYFVIWSMKEYQVEESWTKHQIRIDCDYEFEIEHMIVAPIKVYKNGDVLMFLEDVCLVYYSNKTRTTQRVGMFDVCNATIFTPSLFSLKNFGGEIVISFQTSMQPRAQVEQIVDEVEPPAPAGRPQRNRRLPKRYEDYVPH